MTDREGVLMKTALYFSEQLLGIRRNERCLFCVDSASDQLVCDSITEVLRGRHAAVEVLFLNGKSKAESIELVLKKLSQDFDVVCELSKEYFYDTQVWQKVRRRGARLYRLGAINPESFINCVGSVDQRLLYEFGGRLRNIFLNSKKVRLTTQKGTDITFKIIRNIGINIISKLTKKPISKVWPPSGKPLQKGEATFMGGQLSVQGHWKSINGKAVIDAFVWPPDSIGRIEQEIQLRIKNGRIIDICGGRQAKVLAEWLKGKSADVQHFCIGFNPGARLTDNLTERERVFGSVSIGFGKSAYHTDGVMQNPTMHTDGNLLLENGLFKHKDLLQIQQKLLQNIGV